MHLHPAVVHFVVALIIASAGFEVLGFIFPKSGLRQAAIWTLIFGAIASWVAMLSGSQAVATLPHTGEMHEIIELHQKIGTWIPYIATFLAGVRVWIMLSKPPTWAKGLCTLLLVLLAAAIGYTGWLGGTAVFEYGAGVAPMTEILEAAGSDHEHDGGSPDHHAPPEASDGGEESSEPSHVTDDHHGDEEDHHDQDSESDGHDDSTDDLDQDGKSDGHDGSADDHDQGGKSDGHDGSGDDHDDDDDSNDDHDDGGNEHNH